MGGGNSDRGDSKGQDRGEQSDRGLFSYMLHGYSPSGYPPAGYPPSGYPPAGYPPSGYPPAGYPPSGYPPSGYPPAGYPPSGYAPAGYPGPSGYPPPEHNMPYAYPQPGPPSAAYPPPYGGYPPPGPSAGYPHHDCTLLENFIKFHGLLCSWEHVAHTWLIIARRKITVERWQDICCQDLAWGFLPEVLPPPLQHMEFINLGMVFTKFISTSIMESISINSLVMESLESSKNGSNFSHKGNMIRNS